MFNSPRFSARLHALGVCAPAIFTRTRRQTFSTLGLCLIATVLAGMTGCKTSKDKHTYVSTIYRPTTVTIKDTVTEEFIWKMDIPVEHELTMDFDSKGETEWASVNADLPATSMTWTLKERRHQKEVDSGEFDLPAPHGTIIIVSLRPAPEEPVAISGSYSPEILAGSGRVTGSETQPSAEEEAESAVPVDADSPALLYEPALADAPAPAVESEDAGSADSEMTETIEAVEVTPSSPAPAVEESDPLLDALDLDK